MVLPAQSNARSPFRCRFSAHETAAITRWHSEDGVRLGSGVGTDIRVGARNLRYYGLKSDDKEAWDSIVDDVIKAYGAGSTKTLKHLLELSHDKLK